MNSAEFTMIIRTLNNWETPTEFYIHCLRPPPDKIWGLCTENPYRIILTKRHCYIMYNYSAKAQRFCKYIRQLKQSAIHRYETYFATKMTGLRPIAFNLRNYFNCNYLVFGLNWKSAEPKGRIYIIGLFITLYVALAGRKYTLYFLPRTLPWAIIYQAFSLLVPKVDSYGLRPFL